MKYRFSFYYYLPWIVSMRVLSAAFLQSTPTSWKVHQSSTTTTPHLTTTMLSRSSPSSFNERTAVINTFVNVAAALLSVPRNTLQPFGPPMVEPPPQSPQEVKRREISSRLLDLGFDWQQGDSVSNIFSLPATEDATFAQYSTNVGPNPSTYGEVTTLGARQLFYYMGMTTSTSSKSLPDKDDAGHDNVVFYDLGMGRGKLVVQALAEVNPRKSSGVELSNIRYQAAVMAWQIIQQEFSHLVPNASDRIALVQGDLFQQDLSDATHIYIASLCFSDTMMEELKVKLESLPNLRCIATLKPLPGLKIPRTEYVEMTWTRPNGCQVFFYDF